MFIDILPSFMSMHHVHAWFLQRPEDGVCSIWVLGIEFRSFRRVASAFAELYLLPLVSCLFVFVTYKKKMTVTMITLRDHFFFT